MTKKLLLITIAVGIFVLGLGLGWSTSPAWAATPRAKLDALMELVGPAQVAVGRLDQWVQRVKVIFDSPEIKDDLTSQQKQNLVAAWTDLRNDALAAVEALPEDLSTWEPPEELETPE